MCQAALKVGYLGRGVPEVGQGVEGVGEERGRCSHN